MSIREKGKEIKLLLAHSAQIKLQTPGLVINHFVSTLSCTLLQQSEAAFITCKNPSQEGLPKGILH